MTIINRCSVPQYGWHVKEPSLLNGHKLVPSIGQNLQPFSGNGDFSKWVKYSRVGCKSPTKQTKYIHVLIQTLFINASRSYKRYTCICSYTRSDPIHILFLHMLWSFTRAVPIHVMFLFKYCFYKHRNLIQTLILYTTCSFFCFC